MVLISGLPRLCGRHDNAKTESWDSDSTACAKGHFWKRLGQPNIAALAVHKRRGGPGSREVFAMRRHIVRTFVALAAGGTALLTAGLTATTAAAQTGGTHAASYPTTATSSRAGYMDSGRWFRFVGTTVKVPAAGAYDHYAQVRLRGQNVAGVNLAIKPGGGAGSVGWAVGVAPFGMGGGTLGISPAVGDTVRIDLFYNKTTGGVTATATDLTTKATAANTISEGKTAIFNKVEIGTVLVNPASSPTADYRLWQYTDTAVTTTTGIHGTVTGPWTTTMVIDTINGQPSGQVVMSPSFLFNNNANFGVWARAYLR